MSWLLLLVNILVDSVMAVSVPKRKIKYNQTCMLGKEKFGREKSCCAGPRFLPCRTSWGWSRTTCITHTRLTKVLMAIFALAEKLPMCFKFMCELNKIVSKILLETRRKIFSSSKVCSSHIFFPFFWTSRKNFHTSNSFIDCAHSFSS